MNRVDKLTAAVLATGALAGGAPGAEAASMEQLANKDFSLSVRSHEGNNGVVYLDSSQMYTTLELGRHKLGQLGLRANTNLNETNLGLKNVTGLDIAVQNYVPPTGEEQRSITPKESISFYRDEHGKWNVTHKKAEKGTPDAVDTTIVLGRHAVAHYTEYNVDGRTIIANSKRSTNTKQARKTFQQIEDRAAEMLKTIGAAAPSPEEAKRGRQAAELASKLSKDLYNPNYPNGIPVQGVLNGSVKVSVPGVSGEHFTRYRYPIALDVDQTAKGLTPKWFGVLSYDKDERIYISPVKAVPGTHYGQTQTLEVPDKQAPILEGAVLKVTHFENKGPDTLTASDATGKNRFPEVVIQTEGDMK